MLEILKKRVPLSLAKAEFKPRLDYVNPKHYR